MNGNKIARLKRTTLSEREAEVTSLRIEGATFREIGTELDISPQNAHKAWQRAKKKAADAEQSVKVFKEIGLVD